MQFSKIKSITTEAELENCYDLQTADAKAFGHSYWANGILSHNTEIICGICKAIDCPTVVIADQTVVIDQLKARLELREIDSEIGLFYAGKRPDGETIVVGSIQSLQPPTKPPEPPTKKAEETDEQFENRMEKWESRFKAYKTRRQNAKYLQRYIKNAEMVIVDECVDESAYISTDKGLITAGDLYKLISDGIEIKARIGDKYYSIVGTSRKKDDTLSITTTTGLSLRSSKNHPFAVFRNGYRIDVHAKDLQNGDLLFTNRVTQDNTRPNDWWYWAGLFIGDGHMVNNRQVKFGVRKDKPDWRRVVLSIAAEYDCEYLISTNSRNDLVLRLHSEDFVNDLCDIGFSPGRKMGKISPKFRIPDKDCVAGVLQGLFDSEGSGYHDHANFDSSDLDLAKFVQVLLSYLGIGSSLYISNKRINPKHAICWRVSVTGEHFNNFLNLVNFRFKRKLRESYSHKLDGDRNIDPRPYLSRWLKIIPTMKLAAILGIHHTNLRPSCINKVSLKRLIEWQKNIDLIARTNITTYETARDLLGVSDRKIAQFLGIPAGTAFNHRKSGINVWVEYVDHIKNLLKNQVVDKSLVGFAVEPVAKIEHDQKIALIDFTVEDSASFEANGLLVHNCDKAVSDPYKRLFRHWFKGRRRYGFSGTPFDFEKPVEGMVMQEHLGSPIARESRRNLEKIGRIISCEYFMLTFGLDGDMKEGSAYDIARTNYMFENRAFHKLIRNICKRYPDDGTLILVDSILLGKNLEKIINEAGIEAYFIYGGTNKRRRTELLRAFEKREFRVLIGGKIINRGLDLAGGCENLIIATGGKLQSDIEQKIGRALRHNKMGYSRVFDFYFRCNRYLYAHSKARLKTMIAAGYRTEVVFPGGMIKGPKLVQSRFRIPKKYLTKL